jgi:hypothetical protein
MRAARGLPLANNGAVVVTAALTVAFIAVALWRFPREEF